MSAPLPFRPPPEARMSNEARLLASRLRRAEQRRDAAEQDAELASAELTGLYVKARERFGRDIPADALLLDVLASIDIEQPGDIWRWNGTRNNKGLPTMKYVEGRRNHEKSVIRYLAIAFGIISEEDDGLLYPDEDPDDINPWHRTLRRASTPQGNRWRFQPKPEAADGS